MIFRLAPASRDSWGVPWLICVLVGTTHHDACIGPVLRGPVSEEHIYIYIYSFIYKASSAVLNSAGHHKELLLHHLALSSIAPQHQLFLYQISVMTQHFSGARSVWRPSPAW